MSQFDVAGPHVIRAHWPLHFSRQCQEQSPLERDNTASQLLITRAKRLQFLVGCYLEAALPTLEEFAGCDYGVVNRIRPEGDKTCALNGRGIP